MEWETDLKNDKLLLWAEFFNQKSEEMFLNSWKASSLKMLKTPSWNFDIAIGFIWEEILVDILAQFENWTTETPQIAHCDDSLADIFPVLPYVVLNDCRK